MSTEQERKEIYNTHRWRKLRIEKLNLNPLCEECEREGITMGADIVHHRVHISDGGDPFPEVEGLESLCLPCHSKHHNAKELTEEQNKFLDLMKSL